MIIQCNSCQKKFTVQDSMIPATGRIVQCGSCGNKWTQYLDKPNKKKPPLYTEEYLEKKYNIKIDKNDTEIKNKNIVKVSKTGLGFYGLILFTFILITTLYGIMGMSREFIEYNYPNLSYQIDIIYEVTENILQIIKNIF